MHKKIGYDKEERLYLTLFIVNSKMTMHRLGHTAGRPLGRQLTCQKSISGIPGNRRNIQLAPAKTNDRKPPSLLSLADLSPKQISDVIALSSSMKLAHRQNSPKHALDPANSPAQGKAQAGRIFDQSLRDRIIAIMFSKRSTRTRVASETAVYSLGGHPMFLGPSDIQLGVNESLYDTAKIVSSMADGIIARVGGHDEIEVSTCNISVNLRLLTLTFNIQLLAKESDVPVLNALSARYHPTQILADLQTMIEDPLLSVKMNASKSASGSDENADLGVLAPLKGLKVAWVGDSNNILADMLVAYPRLGIDLSVAVPKGYDRDEIVWGEMQDGLRIPTSWRKGEVEWTNDPAQAVRDADVIVTDTWISMGDEASKDQRLRDFSGYQVTEALCKNAKPDWKFMHCLPRKQNEVDDQVFYGDRSIVFPEGENRRWTIQALVDKMFGRWEL